MKDQINTNDASFVELIDRLAPINNLFRATNNPIQKIEILWDFGNILNIYLTNHEVKLHELLYKIYDPHSNIKNSYITRDIGSYAFRVYSNFKSRDDIKKQFIGLNSYSLFREAFPLLFNDKYKIAPEKKVEILRIITSEVDNKKIIKKLRIMKQDIVPIRNPRDQKKNDYDNEKNYLNNLLDKLKIFYKENTALPEGSLVESNFGDLGSRNDLVSTLMALASDSFSKKVDTIVNNPSSEGQNLILSIAKKSSIDKARFRKWALASNDLLKIAEALHSLSNKDYYQNFRNKLIKQ